MAIDTITLSVSDWWHKRLGNPPRQGIRCPARALALRQSGLGNQKNRLDHRENDSRAISSRVCKLLSDSNEKIVKLRHKSATLRLKALPAVYIIHIFAKKRVRNTR